MPDADAPLDDADVAVALYELAAPDLPSPSTARLERTRDVDVVVWAIHAKGLVVRMKVAATEASSVRLRRGALLLPLLAARGLRVPEPLRLVERPGGTPLTVALERRLGTTDAAVGWPILGGPGRLAFAEALARSLLALHASAGAWRALSPSAASSACVARRGSERVSGADAAPGSSPATLPWRAEIEARVRRRVALLRESEFLASEVADRVSDRLLAAASKLPERIEPALCHGGFALSAASLERRAFAGLHDLELACLADPWVDVTAVVAALCDRAEAAMRRFIEVYGSVVPPPDDLSSRLDLYAGLVLLRKATRASASHVGEGCAMVGELVEAWTEAEPPSLT